MWMSRRRGSDVRVGEGEGAAEERTGKRESWKQGWERVDGLVGEEVMEEWQEGKLRRAGEGEGAAEKERMRERARMGVRQERKG